MVLVHIIRKECGSHHISQLIYVASVRVSAYRISLVATHWDSEK